MTGIFQDERAEELARERHGSRGSLVKAESGRGGGREEDALVERQRIAAQEGNEEKEAEEDGHDASEPQTGFHFVDHQARHHAARAAAGDSRVCHYCCSDSA